MGSYPPAPPPEPQILPPDYSYAPQPVRRPQPRWAAAPATYLLVGINCLVFVVMVLRGVSIGSPTTEQLMHFGADNAGNVLVLGEWWRIVSAMFVHVGILHLATNMWCLWNLGLLAEPLVGSAGLLAVYILTGAAGNLLSTCVNWILAYARCGRRHLVSGGRGGFGRGVWHCRGADCAAEVEPACRCRRMS